MDVILQLSLNLHTRPFQWRDIMPDIETSGAGAVSRFVDLFLQALARELREWRGGFAKPSNEKATAIAHELKRGALLSPSIDFSADKAGILGGEHVIDHGSPGSTPRKLPIQSGIVRS